MQTKKYFYVEVFICIAVIKILLMGLFSSDYQDQMFKPFVNVFLEGNNPYSFYYDNDLLASFPYFPLMLLFESMGGVLIKVLSISSVFWNNCIFKLPLIIFDIVGYYYIRKMGVQFKYTMVFYFCSPIILYGTYMHGQLDVIPTTLLIIAIYHLLNWKSKTNLFWYSVFLGLALGTKLHILASVPILFFYVAKKRDYKTALKYHLLTVLVLGIISAGFWGEGFIETVLFNKEQSVLLAINFDYGSTQIAMPILILGIIYFSVFELSYFNRNLLISMLGLLFAVFLICVPPMPAWFTWIVPFIVLYFGYVEKDKYKVMFMYAMFNIIYLIYFIFLHRTEYVDLYYLGHSMQKYKITNDSLKYMTFTALVVCLAAIIYEIYIFGVASNKLYKRKGTSFTIGIAGDSGAGKTRLLDTIKLLFGTQRDILFIEGDGDHRWVRGDEKWKQYTALDPQANYLYRQADDIKKLKEGIYVERSEYDHNQGIFTEKKRVNSKKYIVLSGLHSLYLPQLRNVLDLKIYIDTDDELRKFWKIQRDTKERGYSKEKIIAQIEKRYADAERYVYPQKEFADVVITYFDCTLGNCYEENHDLKLSVKFKLSIDLDLEPIVCSFRKYGVELEWKICDDFMHQEMIFDGEFLNSNDINFEEITERNIPQYEDFFTYASKWESGTMGVIQFMLLFLISNKMKV